MSRTRYLYTEGGVPLKEPIKISEDYQLAPRPIAIGTEELTYGNQRATDGTPINTKRRHREYMKANGLALVSDYDNSWKKANAEREKVYAGNSGFDSAKRKQAIADSMERLRSKRK